MNRTKALTTKVFILSFLLLPGLSNQMNGQKKEARKLFPIDDNTAFIDITGRVVIRASQTELKNAVDRMHAHGRSSSPGRSRPLGAAGATGTGRHAAPRVPQAVRIMKKGRSQ